MASIGGTSTATTPATAKNSLRLNPATEYERFVGGTEYERLVGGTVADARAQAEEVERGLTVARIGH